MGDNYGFTAVSHQHWPIFKHYAILQILGIIFDGDRLVIAWKRLDAISLSVIESIVDIDVIILTDCVKLLAICAKETLRKVAVLLVDNKLHVETVAIDYLDWFAC